MYKSYNSKKDKAQVSVETLLAVFIVLIFFVVVLIQASLINSSAAIADTTFSQKNSCLKLSHIISQTYTEGKGTHAIFYLDYDANVFADQKAVMVGEEICYFIARTQNRSLSVGEIVLDNNGEVVITQ